MVYPSSSEVKALHTSLDHVVDKLQARLIHLSMLKLNCLVNEILIHLQRKS